MIIQEIQLQLSHNTRISQPILQVPPTMIIKNVSLFMKSSPLKTTKPKDSLLLLTHELEISIKLLLTATMLQPKLLKSIGQSTTTLLSINLLLTM